MRLRERYAAATSRNEKGAIITELEQTLGCHRKHAIRALNGPPPQPPRKTKRSRPKQFQEALPAILLVWEALDFPCAERLHPVLVETAEHLAGHGELVLDERIRQQLGTMSRSTLARRLAEAPSPKARRMSSATKAKGRLRSEVPVDRYAWDESRPGALEVDLVEHNGSHSIGHFAYTLSVVDVVSGYSRRRAVLGRGRHGVVAGLGYLVEAWPMRPWSIHADNGSEFLNDHLLEFSRERGLEFTRSRPYQKNDNAHVEQKNRQFVREFVGYGRYDTPDDVEWLNTVYGILDPYANLWLPSRKVVTKERHGAKVSKRYDTAQTPVRRLVATGSLSSERLVELRALREAMNPMQVHRELERLLAEGPPAAATVAAAPNARVG